MKRIFIGLSLVMAVTLTACHKELSSTSGTTTTQTAVAQMQAVAVATSTRTSGDSIYVVHTCAAREHLVVTDQSSLPSIITDYLAANYNGYSFSKAFIVQDSSGTVTGYVVVIDYNGNPVGLKFDSSGTFVKVLEQREGRDLIGNGWHHGGCFDDRDGMHRDTLALTSVPSAILAYMTTNYPGDKLIHAVVKNNGEYLILSRNNGLFATEFSATGTFIRHIQLPAHDGVIAAVDESALPNSIATYLAATYPGYVFEKAFSLTRNGVLSNYCVIINANNTRYAVLFDAAGNFVAVKVIG